VAEALRQVWEAAGRICAKRLVPFLPTLVAALERHGELVLAAETRRLLLALSPATADRLLAPYRRHPVERRLRSPAAPSAVRAQVPLRTFGEWADATAGAMQADLVVHSGPSGHGFFLTTLVAVDVATGWTELEAVWGRGQERVAGALERMRRRLPFVLRELHTDNGAEFLNAAVLAWSARAGVRLSRGRPYRKNDQAWAEQRNWTAVRRLVGYDRFASHAALAALTSVYALAREELNYLRPMQKLVEKRRHGARVVKRYDRAQTPHQRLLAAGTLDADTRCQLEQRFGRLNPVALRRELQAAVDRLAAVTGPSVTRP